MIEAERESRCGGCDEPIVPGDRIGVVDDEWVCETCVIAYGGEDGEDGDA